MVRTATTTATRNPSNTPTKRRTATATRTKSQWSLFTVVLIVSSAFCWMVEAQPGNNDKAIMANTNAASNANDGVSSNGMNAGNGANNSTTLDVASHCLKYMEISDHRDNRMDENEFAEFVAHFDSTYQGSTFDDLPDEVSNVFDEFQMGGVIHTTGSRPNQNASLAQMLFLYELCDKTTAALNITNSRDGTDVGTIFQDALSDWMNNNTNGNTSNAAVFNSLFNANDMNIPLAIFMQDPANHGNHTGSGNDNDGNGSNDIFYHPSSASSALFTDDIDFCAVTSFLNALPNVSRTCDCSETDMSCTTDELCFALDEEMPLSDAFLPPQGGSEGTLNAKALYGGLFGEPNEEEQQEGSLCFKSVTVTIGINAKTGSLERTFCGTNERRGWEEFCIQFSHPATSNSSSGTSTSTSTIGTCSVSYGGKVCPTCEFCGDGSGLHIDCDTVNPDLTTTGSDGCLSVADFVTAQETAPHGIVVLSNNTAIVRITVSFSVEPWVLQDRSSQAILYLAFQRYASQVTSTLRGGTADEVRRGARMLLRQQQQQQQRNLRVVFNETSAQVENVVPCETGDCVTVTASYELLVTDEDPEAVQAQFTEATQEGINDGKVTEMIASVAPDSQIVVMPPQTPDDTAIDDAVGTDDADDADDADEASAMTTEMTTSTAKETQENNVFADDHADHVDDTEDDAVHEADLEERDDDHDETTMATEEDEDEDGDQDHEGHDNEDEDEEKAPVSAEDVGADADTGDGAVDGTVANEETVSIQVYFNLVSEQGITQDDIENLHDAFHQFLLNEVLLVPDPDNTEQKLRGRRRYLRESILQLYYDRYHKKYQPHHYETNERGLSHQSNHRRLLVTLKEDSLVLNALGQCPPRTTVLPFCLTIDGQYDLIVNDEDPEAVRERYTSATQNGVDDGSLGLMVLSFEDTTHLLVSPPPPGQIPEMPPPPTTTPEEQPPANAVGSPGDDSNSNNGDRNINNDDDNDGEDGWSWYWMAAAVAAGCIVGFLLTWCIRRLCCKREEDDDEDDRDDDKAASNADRDLNEKATDRDDSTEHSHKARGFEDEFDVDSYVSDGSVSSLQNVDLDDDDVGGQIVIRNNTDSEDDGDDSDNGSVDSDITTESDLERRQQYREQIEPLIKEYFPEKLPELDDTLREFKGREEEVLMAVRARANVERRRRYRETVEELIDKYFPEKKNQIDDLMDKFKGQEPALVAALKWRGIVVSKKRSLVPFTAPLGDHDDDVDDDNNDNDKKPRAIMMRADSDSDSDSVSDSDSDSDSDDEDDDKALLLLPNKEYNSESDDDNDNDNDKPLLLPSDKGKEMHDEGKDTNFIDNTTNDDKSTDDSNQNLTNSDDDDKKNDDKQSHDKDWDMIHLDDAKDSDEDDVNDSEDDDSRRSDDDGDDNKDKAGVIGGVVESDDVTDSEVDEREFQQGFSVFKTELSKSERMNDDDDDDDEEELLSSQEEEKRQQLRKEIVDLVHNDLPEWNDDIDEMMTEFIGREEELLNAIKVRVENKKQDKKEKYRRKVEKLLQRHFPEKVGEVDAMMEEFEGKEQELVAALKMKAKSKSDDANQEI